LVLIFIISNFLKIYNANEEDPEQIWKRLYFRTKDGRFQWFAVSLIFF